MAETKLLEIHPTRRMSLAEMKAKGRWKIINVFEVGGGWLVENGVFRPNPEAGGYVIGVVTGPNLFSCGFCGTIIKEHYTVKCGDEEVNVGNQCIHDIVGPIGDSIVNAVNSLKSKVEREYKRKVHNEQLREWLNNNVAELDRIGNEYWQNQVDEIEARGYFERQEIQWGDWTPDAIVEWEKAAKRGDVRPVKMFKGYATVKVGKVNIKTRINFRGEEEQIEYVSFEYDRHIKDLLAHKNYWIKTLENYRMHDWNPTTMRKSFINTLELYGSQLIAVPKLRKLTEDEKKEIALEQEKQMKDFLAKIERIQERKI